VAKFTDALTTPSFLPRVFSIRLAQAAQVMPAIGMLTLLFFVSSITP